MTISQGIKLNSGSVELIQNVQWKPRGLILTLLSPMISHISKRKIVKDMHEIKSVVESKYR